MKIRFFSTDSFWIRLLSLALLGVSLLAGGTRPSVGLHNKTTPDGVAAADWNSIREQIRTARYQVTWQTLKDQAPAYRAPNPAQGFGVTFAETGFSARGKDWHFALRPMAYAGWPLPSIMPRERLQADRAKVTYRWSDPVTEWYRNGPEGVEHGFTLAEPPKPYATQVVLAMAVHTNLRPLLDKEGQSLILMAPDATGGISLRYERLQVSDADGRSIPAHFALSPSGDVLNLVIDTAAARYPLTVNPLLYTATTILRASDAQTGDLFGWSLSLDGSTLAVGAPHEGGGGNELATEAGAAYLFSRNQGGANAWGQVKVIRASEIQAYGWFGLAVSLSADTLTVGAPQEKGGPGGLTLAAGAVYVFSRNKGGADNWGQVKILYASDGQAGDGFGSTVSLSGDTLAVGSPKENGGAGNSLLFSGASYVFARNQNGADNWGQIQILRASDAQQGDYFGTAVSIRGDTLAVGAPYEDGGAGDPASNAGAVYLFARNQGGANHWGEARILHASNQQANDNFGWAVSLDENTLAASAPCSAPSVGTGAAYVFSRNQGGADLWGQVRSLQASDRQASDRFGWALSLDGDTLAVGAPYEDGGPNNAFPDAGSAYIFRRNAGGADQWNEVQNIHAPDKQTNSQFGAMVNLNGPMLIVAAPLMHSDTGSPILFAGAVCALTLNTGRWEESNSLRASERQANDLFGSAISLNGDTLAVGAPGEDGGPGDPSMDTGTVYVFTRNQGGADTWGQIRIVRPDDGQTNDRFGSAVSLNGDTLAVGAPGEDGGAGDPTADAGAAYVFARNQGGADNWGLVRTLHAADMQVGDRFGSAIGLNGDTLAVGAPGEDGGAGNPTTDAGAAYVFARNQGGADAWGEVRRLHAPDLQANDWFGTAVSLDGDTLAVSAPYEDGGAGDSAADAGAVYMFTRNQGGADSWDSIRSLHAADQQAGDRFGLAISLNGDALAIGAPYEDGGPGDSVADAGTVYMFTRNRGGADNWGQIRNLHAGDLQAGDRFGWALGLDGDFLPVGAPYEDGESGDSTADAGAVYVFARNRGGADNWGQVGILHASGQQTDYRFGSTVNASARKLAAAAPGDGGGPGNPTPASGAVLLLVPLSSTLIYLPFTAR